MENCIFCKIVSKDIPALIVGENENAIAFLDVNPFSDGHTLVIPKKHSRNFLDTDPKIMNDVISLMQKVAKDIDYSKLKPWGFNYLSNQDHIAGQEVFHFHFHVIPKYGKADGFIPTVGVKMLRDVKKVHDLITDSALKSKKK